MTPFLDSRIQMHVSASHSNVPIMKTYKIDVMMSGLSTGAMVMFSELCPTCHFTMQWNFPMKRKKNFATSPNGMAFGCIPRHHFQRKRPGFQYGKRDQPAKAR